MARRGDSGSVTFDLVPDGEPEEHGDGFGPVPAPRDMPAGALAEAPGETPAATAVAPSVLTRAARSTSRWLRARSPLQLVAGALALTLGIGGWSVASVMQDRAHEARLHAAPGGVLDLSGPLRVRWSYQAAAEGLAPIQPLGVLDGGILVVGESSADPSSAGMPAPGDPTVLHGVDLGTGDERWTVRLEDTASCGESVQSLGFTRLALAARPVLVCVVGEGAAAQVAVVHQDGGLTMRSPEDVGELTTLVPGPRGTLLRLQPADPVPEGVEVQLTGEGGLELSAAIDPPDVVVSAEEPLTGSPLWSTTLDAQRSAVVRDAGGCIRWSAGGDPRFDVRGAGWVTTADGIYLWLCGVTAVLTTSGDVVKEGGQEALLDAAALADGGFALYDGRYLGLPSTAPARVIDRRGDEVLRVEGTVLDPAGTDGTGGIDLAVPAGRRGDDGVLLTSQQNRVSALEADGTQRWSVRAPGFTSALVRADGVMVVLRGDGTDVGTLKALELDDGRTRWSTPVDGAAAAAAGSFGFGFARGAWTDGEVALMSLGGPDGYGTGPEWTAVDLRTGREVWHLGIQETAEMMTMNDMCFSAAGALLCTDNQRLRRMA